VLAICNAKVDGFAGFAMDLMLEAVYCVECWELCSGCGDDGYLFRCLGDGVAWLGGWEVGDFVAGCWNGLVFLRWLEWWIYNPFSWASMLKGKG
jgi:hypothetical protein